MGTGNRAQVARVGTCFLIRCIDGSKAIADNLPKLTKVLSPIEIDAYLTVLEKVANAPSERGTPEAKAALKEVKAARARLGRLEFKGR